MKERVNPALPFTLPPGHRGRLINHKIVSPDDGTVYYPAESHYTQANLADIPEPIDEEQDRALMDFVRNVRERRDYKEIIADSYLATPKALRFSKESNDRLMRLAINNEHVGYTEKNSFDTFKHLTIAGSCFIEVAVTTKDIGHTRDDERIGLVDRGIECYTSAIEIMEQKMVEDPKYLSNVIEVERAKVHLLFSNVYKDIVTRELTDETVSEIRSGLREMINTSSHFAHTYGFTDTERTHHYGYGGELISLLHFWDAYSGVGDPIAIPSTERGDSGVYRQAETHDIITMKQKRRFGRWGTYEAYEVKRRAVTKTMKERYMARIMATLATGEVVTHQSEYDTSQKDQAS